jgi:phage terminase large subunit-like protein
MSCLPVELLGLPPTLQRCPSDARPPSQVERDWVREFLALFGLVLDGWQEDFLLWSIARRDPADFWDDDAMFAAFKVLGVVPRQNGKGEIMIARQLLGLFVFRERLQVHTAHEFKTCVEHFLRIKGLVERSPFGPNQPDEQVKIIRTGAGDQAIELHNGCRLRFLARSRTSGRGFSADVFYFDEAFELASGAVGSILPTLSARPNPQVWYFSSAPHFASEELHGQVKQADADDDPRMFCRLWENVRDTRLDDVGAWRRVNPALGIRISEEFIANEMRTLCATPQGVAEYQRERLGVREGGDGEAGVVPYDEWMELGDSLSRVVSSLSFGLSVSPDGAWSSFASAGRRRDGLMHVDTVDRRPGTAWVVDRAVELQGKRHLPVRVNPAAAEGALIKDLVKAGVELVEVPAREYQQACGAFLLAVENGRLRHLDQESMNRAVAAAGRRDVGNEGAWVWTRPGAVDVSPLTAVTLALTGVEERRGPRIHVLEGVAS